MHDPTVDPRPLDIVGALRGERIFITGATGFIGKVLVEKLLWSVPEVGKLLLLIRPGRDRPGRDRPGRDRPGRDRPGRDRPGRDRPGRDRPGRDRPGRDRPGHDSPGRDQRAADRLWEEILGSPIMARLRALHLGGWEDWVRSKVEAVPGDLEQDRFGLTSERYAELAGRVDRVVASAATVAFDERLDRALALNTYGALRTLALAKDAGNVPLLHVSTCFVSGRRKGVVPELVRLSEPGSGGLFNLDETLQTLDEACRWIGPEPAGDQRLVTAGADFAERLGFNDVYTLSKALGEQLLERHKEEVPTAIVRPAIVESAAAEPLPGWIDSIRVTDPLLVAYGRGRSREFPGTARAPLEIVPVDYVVHTILAALADLERTEEPATPPAEDGGSIKVYQVGSRRNPISLGDLVSLAREGFARTPLRDERGRAICVPAARFTPLEDYRRRLRTRCARVRTLAKGLRSTRFGPRLGGAERTLEHFLHLLQIYGPYVDHGASYEDAATEKLWSRLSAADRSQFPFDIAALDWRSYISRVHIPGLVRFALRAESGEPPPSRPEEQLRDPGEAVRSASEAETLFELFATSARRYPDAVAFQTCREGRWLRYTYGQALTATANIALSLSRRYGIERGDRVVLWASGSPEWVLTTFAVHRLGATIVPLDPQWPAPEIEDAARFVEARLICAPPRLAETLGDPGCPVVELAAPFVPEPGVGLLPGAEALGAEALGAEALGAEALDAGALDAGALGAEALDAGALGAEALGAEALDAGALDAEALGAEALDAEALDAEALDAEALDAVGGRDDLASILFTSGTTVSPKAVPLTHANYLANVGDLVPLMQLRRERLLSVLPIHHVFEQMVGLLVPIAGGSTISYVAEIKPAEISWMMATTRPTVLVAVPRLLELLHSGIFQSVASGGAKLVFLFRVLFALSKLSGGRYGHRLFGKVHRRFGGSLRRIATGGSALEPSLGQSFRWMGFLVAEGYGMTETSPVLSVNPWGAIRFGSVGKPLPGVEVKLRQVDGGANGDGEIWVRGANVMAGYFRNPSATDEALEDGWLNTGDIGRFDEAGYLHISGRTKDVIVTDAGKNVYPEEVELRYRGLPEVEELVVLGLPTDRRGERVTALVVPRPGATEEDIERIREAIAARSAELPSYQQVSRVEIWRGDLPKTTTLKVKRRQLREAVLAGRRGEEPKTAKGAEAPAASPEARRGEEETWAIETLARLTRTRPDLLRSTDRLADLGVDSLTRVELVGEVEARLGRRLDDRIAGSLGRVQDVLDLLPAEGSPAVAKNLMTTSEEAGRS